MIDAMVRSALFGVRNVDKVQNGDTGRCAAATFQLFNAGKNALESATKLHNSLGKGAESAVTALKTVSESSKALETAAKVVKFGSENVNTLLCGAAAYRVLTADDKEKAMAGASIAGVLYHKFAGIFVFNAGDSKVYAVNRSKVFQISRDHIKGNALENCACAGGGHYITIEGARRNQNYNYFIASNSMVELLLNKYGNIEEAINDIMGSSNTEEAVNKLKTIAENSKDNVSALGLLNLFE